MSLVHKSVDVRAEVWRKLRINSELSGVPVRDYLTYLIEQSNPIEPADSMRTAALAEVCQTNRSAAARNN